MWKDGKRVKTTNYSKSGGKLIEYQYKKGELFSQTNFYPTGLKKSIKHFKNGKENSEWKSCGDNGPLEPRINYKNGELVGFVEIETVELELSDDLAHWET